MARISSLEWRSFRKYRQAPARGKRQAPHFFSGLASLPASPAPSFIPSPMPTNSAFRSNVLPLAQLHSVEGLTRSAVSAGRSARSLGALQRAILVPSAKESGADTSETHHPNPSNLLDWGPSAQLPLHIPKLLPGTRDRKALPQPDTGRSE